jgi:hypothetical protein
MSTDVIQQFTPVENLQKLTYTELMWEMLSRVIMWRSIVTFDIRERTRQDKAALLTHNPLGHSL